MPTPYDVALKSVLISYLYIRLNLILFFLFVQVHGIVHDTIEFVHKIIKTEMNSATDNPIVLPERGEVCFIQFSNAQ